VADARVTTRASTSTAPFSIHRCAVVRDSRETFVTRGRALVEPAAGVAAVGHEEEGLRAHGNQTARVESKDKP
jgi:hypothetical protein